MAVGRWGKLPSEQLRRESRVPSSTEVHDHVRRTAGSHGLAISSATADRRMAYQENRTSVVWRMRRHRKEVFFCRMVDVYGLGLILDGTLSLDYPARQVYERRELLQLSPSASFETTALAMNYASRLSPTAWLPASKRSNSCVPT